MVHPPRRRCGEILRRAGRAGRDGEPRLMGLAYFALGDDAEASARSYLTDYYAWLG